MVVRPYLPVTADDSGTRFLFKRGCTVFLPADADGWHVGYGVALVRDGTPEVRVVAAGAIVPAHYGRRIAMRGGLVSVEVEATHPILRWRIQGDVA